MSTAYSQVPVLERHTGSILWVYQEPSSWTSCIPFSVTVTVFFILYTLFPVDMFRARIHNAHSSASPLWRHLMGSQGRDMKNHRFILGHSSEFQIWNIPLHYLVCVRTVKHSLLAFWTFSQLLSGKTWWLVHLSQLKLSSQLRRCYSIFKWLLILWYKLFKNVVVKKMCYWLSIFKELCFWLSILSTFWR